MNSSIDYLVPRESLVSHICYTLYLKQQHCRFSTLHHGNNIHCNPLSGAMVAISVCCTSFTLHHGNHQYALQTLYPVS